MIRSEAEINWRELKVGDEFRWSPTEGRFRVLEHYRHVGGMLCRDLMRYDRYGTWYFPMKNRTVWRIDELDDRAEDSRSGAAAPGGRQGGAVEPAEAAGGDAEGGGGAPAPA